MSCSSLTLVRLELSIRSRLRRTERPSACFLTTTLSSSSRACQFRFGPRGRFGSVTGFFEVLSNDSRGPASKQAGTLGDVSRIPTDQIGQIGAGKHKRTGKIDVALIPC